MPRQLARMHRRLTCLEKLRTTLILKMKLKMLLLSSRMLLEPVKMIRDRVKTRTLASSLRLMMTRSRSLVSMSPTIVKK